MSEIPDTPELAMPIGLSPDSASRDAHYQDLATKLTAEVQSDLSVKIWTDPALPYSTINPMVRSAAKFYPTGSGGPGGGTVAADTLIFSTWLSEYLSLRKSAGASAAVPALIRMGNVDSAALTTAVQAELDANARYVGLAPAAKTQFVTDFLAGQGYMLLDAGTKFGTGLTDPAPASSAPAGYRRIDLAFLKPDGTMLDSPGYFEMWGLIGGDNVVGHPLLTALARDVTPGAAPIEGRTRVKAIGQGFADGQTSVTVGGHAAANLYVSPDGLAVYFDAPPGTEEVADVVIDTPGQASKTIASGLRYVTDLTEAVRAIARSLEIRLAEITLRVNAAVADGTLDDEVRHQSFLDIESGFRDHQQAILRRAQDSGETLHSGGIVSALMEHETIINALAGAAYQSILLGTTA